MAYDPYPQTEAGKKALADAHRRATMAGLEGLIRVLQNEVDERENLARADRG